VGNVVKLRTQEVVQDRPHAGGNRRGRRRQFGNIRALPSKKFQASYTGPDGQRHNAPTTFQTRGDAEAWLAMQQSKIIEHRWKPTPPPSTMLTLDAYAATWLRGRELKARTRAEYARLLDTKILPSLGQKPLSALTPVDVRMWYAQLDPTRKTRRAHAYSLLRTILGTAVIEELIEANPAHIRGAGGYKRQHQIRLASLAELAAITEHMPPKYRLMVLLASWCALRYGELAELRRNDVDLDGAVLRVRRAVTWPDGKPVVSTPKSEAGARDVAIPPHIIGAIATHLTEHAQPGANGLLFPNRSGEQIHSGALYSVYKPARAAAGRPDLRWHDLRHSGAVWAAQSGATIRELMERLGHSTPDMALRYQHVAEGRQAEIARRLSAMSGVQPT
jgi:integrase